jgi:adenylate kinase family enzyme
MQRVMVIGSPGAGKSTLARRLAGLTGLPLFHLDREHWLPGWTEPLPDDWRAKQTALVAGDRWIIDGNYGGSLTLRIGRADTVIWLDYPTALCLWRAVRRVIGGYGRVRPDTAPGCPERFDPAFLLYIARFRRSKRAKIEKALASFTGEVLRFTRPRQAETWLGGLARG